MEGSTVLGSSYGCRPRNVTQSKYIHIYHNVYVLYVSGRRQTFCSCGLPSSELMCVHALCALLRPLLGHAPNHESGLTVVFRARCGLTSSRAYVLSGGCSARAGGRSALLRPSVGSLGGCPPQTPVGCLTFLFCARCGLTSSRAYVLSGGCSAGVIGRFCVG